jgi:hypothetical protein
MEWIKLRSLRSTWWTFGISGACAIGSGVVVGLNTKNAADDLTNNALSGVIVGLLLVGVLGVLSATGEFTSGLIRSTLASSPRRWLVVAGKTVVFGSTALVVGEATAFLSFFVGGAALRHGIAAPTLGQPGVLRAILFSGASFCLIGLLGLGLGLIIRHTAAAVAVLVGGVYVIAQMIGAFATRIDAYMPILIVANSLSTTKPLTCGARHTTQCREFLPATDGLLLLCLYAAIALTVGGWTLARRDA